MPHLSKHLKKIHLVIAIVMTVMMLLTPILGSISPVSANADNFILNKMVFGPNEQIIIDVGTLTNGCDEISTVSDIYVVPKGTATSGADLRSLDPAGVPNALAGGLGGVIAAEVIGITTPSGKIGNGEWDVVEDVCQDGVFDSGDSIHPSGFVVDIQQVDVQPLPGFDSLKSNAATQRDLYDEGAERLAELFNIMKALDAIGSLGSFSDFLSAVYYNEWKLLYSPISSPEDVAVAAVVDLSRYYGGIAADPPDPAFYQLSPLGNRPTLYPPNNDPLIAAMLGVGTSAGNEAELMEALLASLERYQGAELKDNGEWALIHARAIQNYADISAEFLLQSNDSLAALEAALLADTRNFDAASAEFVQLQSRIATTGLTDDEIRDIMNLGLTEDAVAELEATFLAGSYDFNKANLLAQLGQMQTANLALIADLNTLSADMAPIITTLENNLYVGDQAPVANAGIGYNSSVGTAVNLDGSASTNVASGAVYEWDLDGDGEFDDASGVTAVFTYTEAYTGLVGLKVTNGGNSANIDYTAIAIAPTGGRATITASSPTDRLLDLTLGSSLTFSITASDPLTINWGIDGNNVGTGNSYTFTPDTADIGWRFLYAQVSGTSHYPVSQFWIVRVNAEDIDGDGWNSNVDCDETDVNINPGMDEIVGNGIDDDCDVTTSDVPPVPDFSFAPQTPLTDQAVQFSDASTDADGSIVAWSWDFGDGITSTLQNPSHSFASAGDQLVTLAVTDNDGGIEQTSQVVTINQALSEPSFIISNDQEGRPHEGGIVSLIDGGDSAVVVDSSGYYSFDPSRALDTSLTTGWRPASGTATEVWMKVELSGETDFIDQVRLASSSSYIKNFEVMVSNTDTADASFTTVYSGTAVNNTSLQSFSFPAVEAAYVKLLIHNTHTTSYLNVTMFEVLTVDGVNIAGTTPLNAAVVDYSSYYTYLPEYALDYNSGNRWRSGTNQVTNQWITIRLAQGSAYPINRVYIDGHIGTTTVQDFEVQVSNDTADEADFVTVLSGTLPADGAGQFFTFPTVEARYVKLVMLNNYGSTSYMELAGFQVYAIDRGGLTVPFEDTSDHQEIITGWQWDFGDGSSATEQHPTHTYAAPGTYSVTLTIQSALETVSRTQTYTAYGPANAYFNLPSNPREGYGTPFADASTPAPETTIVDWHWETSFDSQNGQNRTFNFPDNGDWLVTLTVLDSNLIQSTYSQTVSVANVVPTVVLSSNPVFFVGNDWVPDYYNINDAGLIDRASLTCEWDFGDGQTAEIQNCSNANVPDAAHPFQADGTYNPTLTVTDKDGGSSSWTLTLNVIKKDSELTILGLDSIDANTAEVKLILTDNDGEHGPANKQIELSWASGTGTATTNAAGVATALLPLAAGQDVSLTAVFEEDQTHLASSDAYQTTVSSNPTDFWLAFSSNGGAYTVEPALYIAGAEDASGFVAIPGLDYTTPFTVAAGVSTQILLPPEVIQLQETVTNDLSVYVAATEAVEVYGFNQRQYSTDAFVGLAVDELGTRYYTASFNDNAINTGVAPTLVVVGTEDNTTVQITPAGGSVYTVTLQEGQAHQLLRNLDLTGSYVEASAPVAVFGSHDCAFVPYNKYACDHLVEQMLPVSAWGWNYLSMPLATRLNGDTFRILAAYDNTQVFLNGAPIATLNAGEFHNQIISGPAHFTADQPIMVVQYANGTNYDNVLGDPMMMILPPVEQFAAYYPGVTAPTSGFDSHYLNIVAPDSAVGTITIDGTVITPTDFVPIGSSGFSGIQIPVSAGSHELAGAEPFGVYSYGFALWESYGYPGGGFNLVALNNSAPSANDDNAVTNEDTAVIIDVLANDNDPDGDPLTIISVTQPANGQVVINPAPSTGSGQATLTYTPDADYNSSDSAGLADSFSYTIDDGNSSTATATVSILVNPINDDPTAANDAASTNEDTPVTIDLLVNDSDVDGDSLSVTALTMPALGSVLNNGDGTVTYSPDADLSGADVFSYTVSDANGGLAQAQVTITVVPANDTPTAVDDSAVVDEDATVTVSVLDNDSDIDGDPVQLVSVIAPANGSAVPNPDGSITYSPDPDYNGADSFSYAIDDGSGALGTAVVTVTVNPVNDAPVAFNDLSSTLEDTAVTIHVLDNDVDIDGDSLTVSLLNAPANGSAVVNVDGTISYTPTVSFNGLDTLDYTISDGLETASAAVTITVTPDNDNPEAYDDLVSTAEDTAVTFDVLSNDFDIDGDAISVSDVTLPANGAIEINLDGSLTYTPDADFNGNDSLVYTIVDGQGGAATAEVLISVSPVNDDPVANGESVTTNEDAAITLAVLDNDSDVDGDSLTIVSVSTLANGTVTVNADNSLTYTPTANFNGSDTVTYNIEDGNGGSAQAQVTIIIASVNDDPVAGDDLVALTQNTAVTIAMLDNDSDVDGDSLTVTGVTSPASGTAVINQDGTITYTPVAGFSGADSFDYTVDDGNGGSDTATVIVIIDPVSDVCELYPIALHQDLLNSAQPGDILSDILNGEQAGNFGWLTWTGNTSTPTLINSLTLPGDSDTYVNPYDVTDTSLSAGDWVEGKPGVSNAQGVRAALDMLSYVEIVVPVWDAAQGNGANTVYHISGFATIRILSYDLPGQDQITAEFVGFTSCGE